MIARGLIATVVLGLFAAACGGDDEGPFVVRPSAAPFVPVIESTEVAVGEPRLVFRLLDRDVAPQFPDGATFTVRFVAPATDNGQKEEERQATVLVVADEERYYVVPAPFDRAGEWALEVRARLPSGATQISARLPFIVEAHPTGPALGDPAIASVTPTTAEQPLSEISSDPHPDPRLYTTSIADALAQGQPFVAVFSTPGFCFGRDTCQRALDQVKRLAPEAGILAIHAEVLTALDAPDGPFPTGLLAQWALQNYPWIIVVGADGRLLDKFEVVALDEELAAALARAAD